jgi:NodT family efflux transporter outer membrane factor (OMF) lipoprotein
MSASRGTLAIALTAWLAGCAVGPNYHTPQVRLPDRFAAASEASNAVNVTIDPAGWWRALNDPQLNALIDRAIQANPSLEIALTRLQEARTFEAAVTGQALPVLDASAGAARGTGSYLARGRAGPPLVSATNTKGLDQITSVVGFVAAWEIDLFGRFRREIEAARYDTQAAAAFRNAVLVTVLADVARAYLDMRGLQTQSAVLRQNVRTAQKLLDLVQARYDRGITNELDVTLARRQLATLQAQLEPLASQIRGAQYAIAVLLGHFPEDLTEELAKPELIPQGPDKIDAGLPLDLLRRRPDVQQGERLLAAATARVGVATANLFPRLALTAGAGYQGQGLGETPVANQFIWSAGVAAIWPLLDFGVLDAMVDIADLRTHELLVSYKQTVLRAVQEVDGAISNYAAQQDRLRNLGDALVASQRAVSLATQRYDRGLTDFLNVVDAERQQYDLEEQYVGSQTAVAEQFVALYKALGGGWEPYQSIPPIRQPQPAIIAAFRRVLSPEDPLK